MKLRFSYCLNIDLDFPKIYLLLLPSRQTPRHGLHCYTSFKSFLTCRNDEQYWHVFCFIGWVWRFEMFEGRLIQESVRTSHIFDRKQPYFSVDILKKTLIFTSTSKMSRSIPSLRFLERPWEELSQSTRGKGNIQNGDIQGLPPRKVHTRPSFLGQIQDFFVKRNSQ